MKTDEQQDFEVLLDHHLEQMRPVLQTVGATEECQKAGLLGADVDLRWRVVSTGVGFRALMEWKSLTTDLIATWIFLHQEGLIWHVTGRESRVRVGWLLSGFDDLEEHAKEVFAKYWRWVQAHRAGAFYDGGSWKSGA